MPAYEAVDVHIYNKKNLSEALPGVVVKVYSQDGKGFIGQAVTDASGDASFLLPAGSRYQLRFYRFQTTIQNPQFIEVLCNEDGSPAQNSFEIPGEVLSVPVSKDARFCACSGYFRLPNGAPHSLLDIHFIPRFSPILLEGAGMLAERISIRTDKNGFATTDLVRFGQYDVTIEGLEDVLRTIYVPDAASANLPSLLLPTVASAIYSVTPPVALQVGYQHDLTFDMTLFATDGRQISLANVRIYTADSTVASVMSVDMSKNQITLRGLKTGSTQLLVTPWDTSIVKIPNPPFPGSVLELQVS